MEQGLLHLYYGDGKGKTTAAMGLALRALGSGKRVVIVQFLKGGNSGEIPLLAKLGAEIYRGKAGQKFVFQMNEAEKAATRELQNRNLRNAMARPADLLVLDEAGSAWELDMVDKALLQKAVRERPAAREERYSEDAGRPDNRRGVQQGKHGERERKKRPDMSAPSVRPRGINYALLFTILGSVLVVLIATVFVLGIKTSTGQLYLMHAVSGNPEREAKVISMIGDEAAASALWVIGGEQLDQGYIARAIETFEQAYTLNPKIDNLYNRLMELADAYEASGQLGSAEEVYYQLYTEVDPTQPLAYRNAIAIMTDQGRLFEATDLMAAAYEKTGELSFKAQREQLVPLPPTATLETGRLMLERTTELVSSQGYDIYYLMDDEVGQLPEDGILFESPIKLTEGTHIIRAVCVSSALVSDEVSLKYTIFFPSPSAPKSRILSGTYSRRVRMKLYMDTTNDTPGQEVTIYYTIDGTAPWRIAFRSAADVSGRYLHRIRQPRRPSGHHRSVRYG